MRKIFIIILVVIMLTFFFIINRKPKNIINNPAPEIVEGGQWFNSNPLTIDALKGNVVMIVFWQYACLPCQKQITFLQKMYEKYKSYGFVIIGVHSATYEFEKDQNNLYQAITDFGITYPVVTDNNFETWESYGNRHWSAEYIINKGGNIVYKHYGDDKYNEIEKKIQELLNISSPINNIETIKYLKNKEICLGNLGNVPRENLIFSGKWDYTPESAISNKNSTLTFNFEAMNVYLIARQRGNNNNGIINVFIDNVLHKSVDINLGNLYQLVNLQTSGKHELKLQFEDNNIEIYEFSFE